MTTGHLVPAAEALPASAAGVTYYFPVRGYPIGKIPLHWGQSPNAADLFAARGTPVQAVTNGVVDGAGWDSTGGWFYYIIGSAETKRLHYYGAHLDQRPLVKDGDPVAAGQLIGYVGNTGNASQTTPHLHIGIGTSIKNGSGPEGGAGVPWGNNNCNKYLQHILTVLGSGGPGTVVTPPAQWSVGEGVQRVLDAKGWKAIGNERYISDEMSVTPTEAAAVYWLKHAGKVKIIPWGDP